MVPENFASYHQRARRCREMAEKAEDPGDAKFWRESEQRWLILAEQVEQAADLFDSLTIPYKPK
jgi:hypothetical protein